MEKQIIKLETVDDFLQECKRSRNEISSGTVSNNKNGREFSDGNCVCCVSDATFDKKLKNDRNQAGMVSAKFLL